MTYALRALFVITLFSGLFGFVAPQVGRAQAANLVADGGFESGNLSRWEVCGGVRLTDKQAGGGPLEVFAGRYGLRLGYVSTRECGGGDFFADRLQAYYRGIVVPNDASGLTLSFWYSRAGTFTPNNSGSALTVLLVTEQDPQVRILATIYASTTGGWNLARYELSADELAQARGRRFYLSFTVQDPLYDYTPLAYHIDDIALVPARVRMPVENAPPAALASDNTQPLVGFSSLNNNPATVRADLDGHNQLLVFEGAVGNGGEKPHWKPDGSAIAVAETISQTEPGEPISINSAQIGTLHLLDPRGANGREVFRTVGKKLVPGTPPGCRPPRTDCAPYDNPAIDNFLVDYAWSPRGDEVALNTCASRRYGDGYREDAICQIQIMNLATGAMRAEIKPATGVSWSGENRLLYRVGAEGPLLYKIPQGIYEADAGAAPLAPRLLFAHSQPVDEDAGPAWSPDSRFFVTARFVEGFHYDGAGQSQYNTALMLFDRTAPDNPRQLVLIDFGQYIGAPTWSPDGRFVLYTLYRSANDAETWWADVATGKTGLLTGDIVDVSWRPVTRAGGGASRVYLPLVRK